MPLKTRGRSDRLGSSDMIAIQFPGGAKRAACVAIKKPDKTLIPL
jgi:hypothetical protein